MTSRDADSDSDELPITPRDQYEPLPGSELRRSYHELESAFLRMQEMPPRIEEPPAGRVMRSLNPLEHLTRDAPTWRALIGFGLLAGSFLAGLLSAWLK